MALNIPRDVAKQHVIETYKRTRRITTAATAGNVPYGTAQRWLREAGLSQPSQTASLEHGARHVVAGPDLAKLIRVDRDPCPRCNTRKDIGCKHFPLQAEPERPLSARDKAEAMWSAGA